MSILSPHFEAELEGNLLPFWRERSLDDERGGFIAEMANDGAVRPDAAKGLILNARLLWTFATLFAERGDPQDLALAERSYDFLEEKLRDRVNGGYLWSVDSEGRPIDQTKKIYGQAFVVYALTAYATATGEVTALDSAKKIFQLIETHAHDDQYGGYIEARAEDWSATSSLRLSAKDMDAAKSMNTHLHLLEAYSGLYRLWPEVALATRLRELLELFDRYILDHDRGHLSHFFDQRWTVLSEGYTYGHDIESAWLLCEAAETLGESALTARVHEQAVGIARAVILEAIDTDGGIAYEGQAGEVTNADREWWCQAEAVVGLWQAFQLTRDPSFAEAAAGVWEFITRKVVDRENGEWFWRVRADGAVDQAKPKVSEWKGPYHNVRMCLEMLRRIAGEKGTVES